MIQDRNSAPRLLLVGHAFGPGLGSEPGLTWNWAWHLSEHFPVTVLTHPKYRETVENFLAAHPNPNLCIEWVTLHRRIDPWNPEAGEGGIRLHYLLWQWAAMRTAKRLHRRDPFDLVHHVSWNTLSAPPLLWRLSIPFVWGPVGGGQTAPSAFQTYFGDSWGLQRLRTARIRLLPYAPSLRNAARRAAVLFATNRETAAALERAGGRDVHLMFDNGLPPESLSVPPLPREPGPVTTFLWAGRLEPRKALGLALEALACLPDIQFRLMVAGDGPMRAEWERQAHRLGIGNRVRFFGMVPREQLEALFRGADAFLFSSLQDSSGSVVFEAMAHGLPVIALDHQGIGAFLPDDAGVKVPVTTPGETVIAFSEGLRRLAQDPKARQRMGERAWVCAKDQSWDRRASEMSRWYEACLRDVRSA